MKTLVLLPGLDGTGELFAPFTAACADAIATRVIAYPADRGMTYAEHETWARAQLPNDRDFVLLAESFSGPVGIAIAAAPPPGLIGLVLCASFAANPMPVFGPLSRLVGALPAARIPAALTAPWLYANRATPELRRAHARAMARVTPAAIRARVQAILAVDHRALLERVRVPILYLRATADRLIPASAGLEILRLRPDTMLAEIDAPHFLLQTEPYPAVAAIMRFIDESVLGLPAVDGQPDPPLDFEQSMRVSRLTQAELQQMDRELLSQASTEWRKVARIVGMAIGKLRERIPGVSDIYYAQRVQNLVALGQLESQGNLARMRSSEVRLPRKN